jgi:hypothetical protein
LAIVSLGTHNGRKLLRVASEKCPLSQAGEGGSDDDRDLTCLVEGDKIVRRESIDFIEREQCSSRRQRRQPDFPKHVRGLRANGGSQLLDLPFPRGIRRHIRRIWLFAFSLAQARDQSFILHRQEMASVFVFVVARDKVVSDASTTLPDTAVLCVAIR